MMSDILLSLSRLQDWRNIVDIALVTMLIFFVLQLFRGTQAVQLLRGILVFSADHRRDQSNCTAECVQMVVGKQCRCDSRSDSGHLSTGATSWRLKGWGVPRRCWCAEMMAQFRSG